MIRSLLRPTMRDVAVGVDLADVAGLEPAVGGELFVRSSPACASSRLNTLGPLTSMPPISPAGQRLRRRRRARARATPGSGKPTVPPRRSPSCRAVGVGGEHHGLAHAVALEDGVAGALAPVVEGLHQQRRRAGDEQAHVRAGLARELRLGQQAHVQRRHAHEDGGLGRARDRGLGVEACENQIILLPLSSAPCEATNRPCTWKIGSAWISTSPARQPQ